MEIRNSAGRLGPGLDVRGVGGYVVAPPSVHISGKTYEWSVDHHPDEVPLADFPESLLTLSSTQKTGAPASQWRELMSESVAEGGRNSALASIAGHLLRRYVDPFVVLEFCQLWNLNHCRPPLSADEVTTTVNSICRCEMARRRAA